MALSPNYVTDMLEKAIMAVTEKKDEYVRKPGVDFTRKRKFTFDETLRTIINLGGGSLQSEIVDYNDRKKTSVTASAFVQQRKKIKPEALNAVFQQFNALCKPAATYRGYRLFSVDGSDINIAKNPGTDTYMENGSREAYSQIHLNTMFDLCNSVYTDTVLQGKKVVNEIGASIEMMDRLHGHGKSIVVMDRAYLSYNSVAHAVESKDVFVVIRAKHSGGTFKEIIDLPMKEVDKVVTVSLTTHQTNADKAAGRRFIPVNHKNGRNRRWDFESPYDLKFRIVRFKLSSGNYETLVTNLPQSEFTIADLKNLYHLRWGIETSFMELKYSSGLLHMHCTSLDSSIQEIYAHLISYNYCKYITMGIAVKQKKPNIYVYAINRKIAMKLCRRYYREERRDARALVGEICKYLLPVRPDRQDTRKAIRIKSFIDFRYRITAA